MIFLKAANNVSVILLASPHHAKQLVKSMKGHIILWGIMGIGFLFAGIPEDEADVIGIILSCYSSYMIEVV